MIRDIAGYQTSRDYPELFRLMQKMSIICVVDYDRECEIRDVAHTLFHDSVFQVSARGISYVYSQTMGGFVESCKGVDLEWLVPGVERSGARLLPCPCCGSEDVHIKLELGDNVHCDHCGLRTSCMSGWPESVERWNVRFRNEG